MPRVPPGTHAQVRSVSCLNLLLNTTALCSHRPEARDNGLDPPRVQSPLREGFGSWDFGRALDVLPSLVPLGGIYLGVGCANSGGADVIAALGTEVGLQPAPTSLSRHADHVGEGIGRFRGVVRDDLGLGARPQKVISTPIDSGRRGGRSRSAMYAGLVSVLAFDGWDLDAVVGASLLYVVAFPPPSNSWSPKSTRSPIRTFSAEWFGLS